ncbi:MAG: cadherin-like domain-containing protein [Colwellia sp.]
MNKLQNKNFKSLSVASAILLLASCGSSDKNAAPTFDNSFTFSTLEDSSVSATISASDADNDTLSYTVASAASNGIFELNSGGSFTYTPNADYVGEDTVSVTVSDGDLTAQTSVVFTVENVNDAPVLATTNLTVSSQGESNGQIVITDVDGDAISITVTQAPEAGDLTLNSVTGEFTYTPNTLEQIDGSFTISYTDSIISEALTATIDLVPSFETNADKLSYYYSSDKSHLKQAEAMQAKLEDDVDIDELSANLAVAYFNAGFDDKATGLLESIDELASKAEAYQDAALVFDEVNDHEQANALRAKAELFYNQHMAEQGLDNIGSSDASFYFTLVQNYIDAGQTEQSDNLISTVYLYSEAVREEQYNTAYGRFLTAFRNHAKSAIDVYFSSPTTENKARAAEAAIMNAMAVDKTGYRVSGDTQNYKIKALYLAWAAEYLVWVDATEEAKKYTAKALSLYAAVNYDENYTYAEDENSATLSTYQGPLETLAGVVEALYPELEVNPALALIATDDKDYQDALEHVFSYQAFNNLKAGATITEALQSMRDYFTDGSDLDSLYQTMVDSGSLKPHLAALLHYQGEDELAEQVLIEALALITSEAYMAEKFAVKFISGTQGCHHLVELAQAVTGDASTYQQQCLQAVNNYFSTNAELFSTANTILAYQQILLNLEFSDALDIDALVIKLNTHIALLDEPIDTISAQFTNAAILASYQYMTQAETLFNTGLVNVTNILNDEETPIDAEALDDLIDNILGYNSANNTGGAIGSNSDIGSQAYTYYNYIAAIRSSAGKIDNYAELLSTALSGIKAIVEKINTVAATFSVNEQQGLMEELIKLNMYSGLTAEAEALIALDVNEVADQQEFYLTIGNILAEKDAFPASKVASVDTDNDGLVNFFRLSATQEDIANSGLTADEDSDNDGVADNEDSTPLGE